MVNITEKFLVSALLMMALGACGGSGSSPASSSGAAPGTQVPAAALNFKSGACSVPVLGDYNDVLIKCNNTTQDQAAKICKTAAQDFLEKYPGINCSAVKASATSPQGTQANITANDAQALIDKLTKASN